MGYLGYDTVSMSDRWEFRGGFNGQVELLSSFDLPCISFYATFLFCSRDRSTAVIYFAKGCAICQSSHWNGHGQKCSGDVVMASLNIWSSPASQPPLR